MDLGIQSTRNQNKWTIETKSSEIQSQDSTDKLTVQLLPQNMLLVSGQLRHSICMHPLLQRIFVCFVLLYDCGQEKLNHLFGYRWLKYICGNDNGDDGIVWCEAQYEVKIQQRRPAYCLPRCWSTKINSRKALSYRQGNKNIVSMNCVPKTTNSTFTLVPI